MSIAAESRRFRVHARDVDHHLARVVDEPTFEAAAIAYVEGFASVAGDGSEMSVIVRDVENGHEHCFRVDIETGDTTSCG